MNKPFLIVLAVTIVAGAGMLGYWLQLSTEQPGRERTAERVTHDSSAPSHETIVGSARPAFRLPDINGKLLSISDWDGDILAINFWATWCQPCKDEIPEFVELQSKYRDQGVTFVGVAIDQVAAVSDFVDRYDVNYPVLVGEQAAIDAAKAYGNQIGALPYTAFVDRKGTIVHVHRGRLPQEQAEALLQELTTAPVESGSI